tara:strand:- start:526 stop:717 length:192 start_codon:yes stop_codon:yes gene_type:complete
LTYNTQSFVDKTLLLNLSRYEYKLLKALIGNTDSKLNEFDKHQLKILSDKILNDERCWINQAP